MNKKQTSGRWQDVDLASFDGLIETSSGNTQEFVWPDEGRFLKTGTWLFNDQHNDFQPLLIDKVTADMMLAFHASLNDENKAKFEDWVSKGRGEFAALVEMTHERVTIIGFKGVKLKS